MSYREFYYHWTYDLRSSPQELWPLVADTNRFNRNTGVPAVSLDDQEHKALRNTRHRVRFKILGLPVAWEEQPFEWVRPLRFGVKRVFNKGPLAELRALVELTSGVE